MREDIMHNVNRLRPWPYPKKDILRKNAGAELKTTSNRVLFLTLDIFRQTGGIQQVNKLLMHVLNNIEDNNAGGKIEINTYSLHDSACPTMSTNSRFPPTYKPFSGSKLRFFCECLSKILRADLLILSHIHLLPLALILSLIKPRLRIVLLAHGVEIKRRLCFWKRFFLTKRTEIWAVSRSTALYMKKELGEEISIKVLNNALPPDFILPDRFEKPKLLLKKLHLSANDKVLLTVCRVGHHERNKGIEQVIRCIPSLLFKFPKLYYLIVGKTEAEEQLRLEAIIDALHIRPHVRFLHFIPPIELSNYYLLADIFVMPSKREGFGIAFIEAAACGRRIIAGNTDGSTDAVLDGTLGTLIDPNNAQQLQKAIADLLNKPCEPSHSAAIQSICLQHFSFQIYQKQVINLLFKSGTSARPIKSTTA